MSDIDISVTERDLGRLDVQKSLQQRGYYHQGMSEPDFPSHAFVLVYDDGSIRAGGMGAVRTQIEEVLEYGEDDAKVNQILVNLRGELKPVTIRRGDSTAEGYTYFDLLAGEENIGGFSIFTDF